MTNLNKDSSVSYLAGFSTPESRWAKLGAYYAMFPIDFAYAVIRTMSEPEAMVIDPFCGRGTTPYVAMISERQAIGCEINPVAWLYSIAKTDPHPFADDVIHRLVEIQDAATVLDRKPVNEFQAVAFGQKALAFINAARRELHWRSNSIDRTVAAVMVHFLHAKIGQGLSNQMRHSRSLSPPYCIRWWREHGFGTPPDIDPVAFLSKRVSWRYSKGLPKYANSDRTSILLGDAAVTLPTTTVSADLILTSPPYCGVTNYRADNWLRLWALGEGPALVDWNGDQKFSNPDKYAGMLRQVMSATRDRTKPSATWYIRTDARPRTRNILWEIMADLLPNHSCHEEPAPYPRKTQTALYGDDRVKPGEIDLIFQPA